MSGTPVTGADRVLCAVDDALYGVDKDEESIWRSTDGGQTRQTISVPFKGIILAGSHGVLALGPSRLACIAWMVPNREQAGSMLQDRASHLLR